MNVGGLLVDVRKKHENYRLYRALNVLPHGGPLVWVIIICRSGCSLGYLRYHVPKLFRAVNDGPSILTYRARHKIPISYRLHEAFFARGIICRMACTVCHDEVPGIHPYTQLRPWHPCHVLAFFTSSISIGRGTVHELATYIDFMMPIQAMWSARLGVAVGPGCCLPTPDFAEMP